MLRTFEDENDAFAYIKEQLSDGVAYDLADALAQQFSVYCGMDGGLRDWPSGGLSRNENYRYEIGAPFLGPWTVRDDELGDVKEIAIGVLAAGLGDNHAAVCLVVSAACMVWRLRRRGVSIDPLQRAILVVLRRSGPCRIDELVEQVSRVGPAWTKEEVCSTLSELAAIRLNDGNVVPLVHCASDGRWSTDARGLWEVPFGASG